MKKQRFKILTAIMAIVLSLGGLGSLGTYNRDVYADEVTNDNPDAIEISPGDANFDDAINAEDALAALKHAAKLEELGEYNFIRADVDANGNVDAKDALYILQYAAHILTSFDEVKVNPAPLQPSEVPTDEPTKNPSGYEAYDAIDVDCNYFNSFIVEINSTESKNYTTADFPEVALKDVWTRGKIKTDTAYLYELVLVLDDENCTDEALKEAMNKLESLDGVDHVSYNWYMEHDTIIELNHSEYILELGESVDLSIADYRPYYQDGGATNIILKFNEKTVNGEELSLKALEKYGVTSLTEGSYIPTGSYLWKEYERSEENEYYLGVYRGNDSEISHITVAHLLSQIPEVEMVQIVRVSFPTGNRYYENWACSDETVASMVLSGGEDINENSNVTKLNQTATITGLKPGEITVSVTKGGWSYAEGTGTCVIKVVEPDSAIYEASYPEMASYVHLDDNKELYDEWRDDRNLQGKEYWSHYKGTLDGFYKNTVKSILGKDTNENVILSPVNVYMALAMVAETVDGNARKEILDLIGVESIEDLRKQANAVWNAHYCDDGTVVSLLGNSLWLNNDVEYKNSILKTLSDNYYASSFRGEMGSENYNVQIRNWLNEHTGGMLREQINNIELDPSVLMAMYSTIYFRGKWDDPFWEGATKEDVFYGPEGDIKCDFMIADGSWQDYYWSDKFAAINKEITYGGKMWFILPDEGVSPQEIINDEEYMKLITSEDEWKNKLDYILVNVKLPKFDIDSNLDLKNELKELGIDDIFSTDADFSPIIDDESEIFISAMNHNARVTIDEEGCEATAFTEVIFAGAPMPPEDEVDFIANRPFIFVIESGSGTPLFVGIVNNP